jgi:sialic acid synthase SpsE
MDVPAYKIASPEIIELKLIAHIAKTGKPIIMSTGKATLSEIDNAVRVARINGCSQIALLHCVSEYPAPFEKMNLKTISALKQIFNINTGLSDHSQGIGVAITSVALGASIIEKHFIIDKSLKTPDSFFSMDQKEFSMMVKEIRNIEKAIGNVFFPDNINIDRRSVYARKDIKAGEVFSEDNTGSYRPGGGLMPETLDFIRGKKANKDIKKGGYIMWVQVD